jgi:hypothetical protein
MERTIQLVSQEGLPVARKVWQRVSPGLALLYRPWISATICALHKNAQAGIISNQCHIFVQLVETAKVEMSLIESFAGDYRRWSRIERIVSPAFLIAALGGVASMFTPLLGG